MGERIMTTSKYDVLTKQDKCLVDAEISEENTQAQKFGIEGFSDPKLTEMRREVLSRPDLIEQMEGYGRLGKAPWAKCVPTP